MPNQPFEHIGVESDGNVATITLNRPKVLNALNSRVLAELSLALLELEQNADVRAIVITGAGEKAFVAGADIAELNALRDGIEGAEKARIGQAVTLQIERLRKPVIMAVNGF
ncbi:MAG: enoyl-CoA hydratase-related protein, partial [Candidatus Eremiobacteraeota bacterium]|nr:enoyl-CoA hydratase-related protein [Candidatus Eremiobacteraeota bacterium]